MTDGDFSRTKKEEMSKLTTDQKWQLLKEYKSSTLDMMVTPVTKKNKKFL